MEPVPAPAAASGKPLLRLSNMVLLGIAAIGGILLASIFAYILVISTMRFDSRLWWTGLASMLFALGFYLLYAGTGDRMVLRPMSGGFFLIGAASYYGSIFANPDPEGTKLVWIVILSFLVVAVLFAIFYMARDAEKDAARKAQRRVVP